MKKIMFIIPVAGFFICCSLILAVTAPSHPYAKPGTPQGERYQARYQEGYDDAINGIERKNYPRWCPCAAVICYTEIFNGAYHRGYDQGLVDKDGPTADVNYQKGYKDGYDDAINGKASKYYGAVNGTAATVYDYKTGYRAGYEAGKAKAQEIAKTETTTTNTVKEDPQYTYQDGYDKGYKDGLGEFGYQNYAFSKEYKDGYHAGYFAAISEKQDAQAGYEKGLLDAKEGKASAPSEDASKAFKEGYEKGYAAAAVEKQQYIKGYNTGWWDATVGIPKRNLDPFLPASYRNGYEQGYNLSSFWGNYPQINYNNFIGW